MTDRSPLVAFHQKAAAASFNVSAGDPEYADMARREADFWGSHSGLADLADASDNRPSARHYNKRFTGDEDTRWFQTVHKYGEFKRGLVLGAAGLMREAYILEHNPSLHLTFMDISPGAVEKRKSELVGRFPGRIDTAIGDFNFFELPENAYDLIISSGVAHHVINLDHLASQLNRSLTPEGYFFLEDYVGEPKWALSPEKKLAYELVYNRELTRQGKLPTTLEWMNEMAATSPFCTIRANYVLPAMRAALDEVHLATSGALWLCVLFGRDTRPVPITSPVWRLRTAPGIRRAVKFVERKLGTWPGSAFLPPEFVARVMEVGDRLSDAGVLLPSNAFAVYRKRKG